MLRRKAYDRLLEWKENGKKPLLIYGQRQVGKTYIIKKFAEENYSSYIYADLNQEKDFCKIFSDHSRNISDDGLP